MEAILHGARGLPLKFLVAAVTMMVMILQMSQCEDSTGAAISWNGNDTITSSPICNGLADDCGLIAHRYMDMEFLMDSESSRRILLTPKFTPPALARKAAYNCGRNNRATSCTGRQINLQVKDECKGAGRGANFNRNCNRVPR